MRFYRLKSCFGLTFPLLAVITLFACDTLSAPKDPNLVMRTRPHHLSINSVSWSSDGKWIASASQDATVRIMDVGAQRSAAEITNFRGNVESVAWSPDSKYLAIGSNEPANILRLWEVSTAKTRFMTDPARTDIVTDLSWSPDGRSIAVGISVGSPQTGAPQSGSVAIYDVQSGSSTRVLTNTKVVSSVAWSHSGQFIAAGYPSSTPTGPAETIAVWSTKDWQTFAILRHSVNVNDVTWSTQSDLLASSAFDGSVAVWDVSTKQNRSMPLNHSSIASTVAWSPSGRYLASGSWDGSVVVWDVSSQTIKHRFATPDYANSVAWSPTDDLLVVGCQNGELLIWSVK